MFEWLLLSKLQIHRLAYVGRDLWRPSVLTPLIKQGHLEQVAQDHVQTANLSMSSFV